MRPLFFTGSALLLALLLLAFTWRQRSGKFDVDNYKKQNLVSRCSAADWNRYLTPYLSVSVVQKKSPPKRALK